VISSLQFGENVSECVNYFELRTVASTTGRYTSFRVPVSLLVQRARAHTHTHTHTHHTILQNIVGVYEKCIKVFFSLILFYSFQHFEIFLIEVMFR
jgi:hypothetical protein